MAAYPSVMLVSDSTPRRDAGIVASRATNGKLRARRLFTAEKMEFDLVHWATAAEKDALEAHYQAHRDTSFAFTWLVDGVTRTCSYATAPLPTPAQHPGKFIVSVKLMEV